MTLRYPLSILMMALFVLNVLDYLTTIYALESIPNAYEANAWIKTPEAIFKFKILYGIPIGIAGVLIGFAFDKIRTKIESRFVDFWYYLWLAFVLVVFVDYVFTVAGNVSVIFRYG